MKLPRRNASFTTAQHLRRTFKVALLPSLATMVLASSTNKAWADSSISPNPTNNGYTITLYSPSNFTAPSTPTTFNNSSSKNLYPVVLPTLSTNSSEFKNTPCVAVYVRYYTNKAQAGVSDSIAPQLWFTLNRHYGPCIYRNASQFASSLAPSTSSSAIRDTIIRDLPSPSIAVDPNFGIAGIASYLSISTRLSDSLATTTAFGPLTATSTGSLSISYGDSTSPIGPTSLLGGPWPTGNLVHTYASPGCYAITVTETWNTTYTVSSERGQLTGLTTQGSYPNYCVYLAGSKLLR